MQSNVDLCAELAENQLDSIEDKLNRLIEHRDRIITELTLEDFSSKAILKYQHQLSDVCILTLEPQVKKQVAEQRTLEAAYRQLLLDFKSDLTNLIRQYTDLKDAIVGIKKSNGDGRKRPKKGPPKRLVVTLNNGTKIEHGNQEKTFREVIELVGTERVLRLELGSRNAPLVKRENTGAPLEKGRVLDSSGRYSIYITYSAKYKKEHLDTIFKKLGLQWKVEVIEPL